MPVTPQLAAVLKKYGHEGVHAYHIDKALASDTELLAIARSENRIIITADLDFPRLLALSSSNGPGIILFRGGNYSDAEMCHLLERVLTNVQSEVLESAVCVVDRQRIRITRLPFNSQ